MNAFIKFVSISLVLSGGTLNGIVYLLGKYFLLPNFGFSFYLFVRFQTITTIVPRFITLSCFKFCFNFGLIF